MIYADSSVIVKRYYQEPGTPRVRDTWTGAQHVFTSRVAYAEVLAALARKRREGGLSTTLFRTIASAFETEWPAYDQVLVDNTTLADVRRLVWRHPLRGYDAIHLAAALWLRRQLGETIEFWVSDDR
ncbi:MAG: type II toxin-antitoxin system VapC family toxin [candidate division NC10 bacterium]|nr:type II toxin-antitoxin system VapC family toxin [candidate division NC10 bacterium]